MNTQEAIIIIGVTCPIINTLNGEKSWAARIATSFFLGKIIFDIIS